MLHLNLLINEIMMNSEGYAVYTESIVLWVCNFVKDN